MNSETKAITDNRDIRLLRFIADNIARIGYVALFVLIAHRSFGFPDYGISPL
jgi:hypothetical protein